LDSNKFECRPDAVDGHFKFLHLMEQYGLTRVESHRTLQSQIVSSSWRVPSDGLSDKKSKNADTESDHSVVILDEFERQSALRFQSRMEAEKKEKELLEAAEMGVIRCPICTCKLPCSHFFKEEVLREYLQEKEAELKKQHEIEKKETAYGGNSSQRKKLVSNVSAAIALSNSAKKWQQKDQRSRIETILAETNLDDRNTDRSIAFTKDYREQNSRLEKQKEREDILAKKESARIEIEKEDQEWEQEEQTRHRDTERKKLIQWLAQQQQAKPPDTMRQEDDKLNNNEEEQTTNTELPVPPIEPQLLSGSSKNEVLMTVKPVIKATSSYDSNGKRSKPKKSVKFSFEDETSDAGNSANNSTKLPPISETQMVPITEVIITEVPVAKNNSETPVSNKRIDGSLVNPLPYDKRKMFLFMKDSLDINKPSQAYETTEKDDATGEMDLCLNISGLIFLPINEATMTITPLQSISVKLDAWSDVIDHIRSTFLSDLLPNLMFEPLLDVKSWKPIAPRCQICSIGFVRFADTVNEYRNKYNCDDSAYINGCKESKSQSAELNIIKRLCLPCVIRKLLFEKIKLTLPRNVRIITKNISWPIASRQDVPEKNIEEEFPKMILDSTATFPAITAPTSPIKSPTRSSELWELDLAENTSESSSGVLLSGKPTEQSAIVPLSPNRKGDVGNTVTNSPKKPTETKLQRQKSSNSISTSAEVKSSRSINSGEQNNNSKSEASRSKSSVVEIAMLPFLITKGSFEEAERTLRMALDKQAVDEGQGLKLLLQLMGYQAEMYKLVGLWPLAVGIYLDCADLTASLLGFSDSASLTSWGVVTSCLRKMQLDSLAGHYLQSLVDDINRHTLKKMRTEIVTAIQMQDR